MIRYIGFIRFPYDLLCFLGVLGLDSIYRYNQTVMEDFLVVDSL